jgi:ribonuclease R
LSNKKKSLRLSDPYMERERGRYPNPLPSREMILKVLEDEGVPVLEVDLVGKLDIAEEERESFTRRINAMEREGQLMRNRKGALCLLGKIDLITGKVQGHPDGFGFLIPDDGSPDLFLGPRQMHKALHGDRVMARESGVDRKGRREASIVEVIERANERIVGRLFEEHGILFLVAENKRINQDILVEPGFDGGAKPGQVVMGQIIVQPSKQSEPIARVIEILGNYADPGMEIEIALRKHELPYEFPDDVLALEKKVPKKVGARDIAGREDLRNLPFVTIDGENAKDFDDAVYCEKQAADKKNSGFRLLVGIADVSHYVKPGDAFDREARLRGNSVYFPRRVIPMLPEVLSNGLCSLKPNEDRLVMVCDMNVAATGQIKAYRFYPAVIHSRQRLTYTKVAAFLQAKDAQDRADSGVEPVLFPHIGHLNEIFHALLQERRKRGAIDFESMETEMVFDDKGKIERIVPVVRNDAHRLIEECMLAANVCTSDYALRNEHAALFRIHEGPTPEKLEALRTFLKDFGLSLSGGGKPHAKDYAALLEKVKTRPDAQLLQTVMLRSLQQAVYSPENVGHFGLAYDGYTHFTSPIRRYPDLLIHRAIKAILAGETYKPHPGWKDTGIHCSQTERRADDATRDVQAWLKCYYMQDRLGDTFDGIISGVASFGIFVSLDDVFVEGLVHVSDLGQDYFHFDAAKHCISGERTGKRYQLGGRVSVRVVRVDLETSRIDFALFEERKTSTPPAKSLPHAGQERGKRAVGEGRTAAPKTREWTAGKTTRNGTAKAAEKTDPRRGERGKSGSKGTASQRGALLGKGQKGR